MKKIMSIVLVLTMLMSLAISMTSVNAAVDVEAAQSTASSYDVHIEGNLVIGQTLTAEYTYYDEGGKPEIANGAQYQWYRKKSGVQYDAISGATQKTYTLKAGDEVSNKNSFYVRVATKNADGFGEVVYSNVVGPAVVAGANAPTITNTEIVPLNGNGSIMPGDTLKVNYGYQEPSGVAEGTCEYQWNITANINGGGASSTGQTGRTYVVRPEDYGKYIQVYVTPVDANGVKGTRYQTVCKAAVGNLFIDSRANVTNVSGFYGNTYFAIKQLNDGSGSFPMATYGAGAPPHVWPSVKLEVDAGRMVKFDSLYLAGNNANICEPKVSYSTDNVNWNVLAEIKTEGAGDKAMIPSSPYVFPSNTVLEGRYFKLEFLATDNKDVSKNSNVSDMWPFLSKEAYSDAFSMTLAGAAFDNDLKSINITNTALKAANVLAAVVIPTGATKKIFDKSNVEVTGVDAVVPLGGKIVVTSQDTKNTSTYSVVSDSMDTSITSTGFGGVIDPEAKAINNITLGVPFTEFLTSVVTKNNTAAKTVVKADGSSAGDTTALRIDAKTATEYKIKVSSADSQFSTLYSIGIAAAANKNYEFLDTTTKYGKTSGKIPESTAGYWGGGSLTEAGAYAIGTEGASGKAVKIATTADVETTGTFLQYYDAKLDINGTDSYSISMDVRPSENISFEVSGRYNSVSGPFLSNIVRFDSKTKKITAGETVSETDPGTYIELGDYMPNTWYNVSYSFNVSTKLADVWVNGVKVRTDYPIATPDAGTEATIMIPFMKFINTVKAEDYVCFDNITFQKVYDTHTNGQLGNPVINDEVKLYANNAAVTTLSPSTNYTVSGGFVNYDGIQYMPTVMMCREYYKDNEANTFDHSEMLSVYTGANLAINAGNIFGKFTTPAELKTTHASGKVATKVVIKSLLWNANLAPINNGIKVWE